MPSRHSLAAVLVTVAVLAGAPAAGAALTATVDQRCYTHVPTQGSQTIVVTIAGGTPGANFLVTAAGPGKASGSSGSASGTFDAAGNAVAELADVSPPSGSIDPLAGQKVTISVTDYGVGETAFPVVQAVITNLAMDVSNKPRNPRRPRRVRVSGTPFAGKTLYGFVTRPGGRKVLRKFRLGKANACGFASSRQIVAPIDYRSGEYRLYINAGKRLNKARALAFSFRLFTY